ncbi:MAG: hypothetical protein HY920_00375 [Elusimicrobia bacterium]|nr:hypothetical protein [Elusimicrobiota bacterium]
MQFANVRELKLETNKILELSRKHGPIIVMRRGHPVAFLRTISEADFAVSITPLWNRLRQAAEHAGYTAKDVEKLIKRSRAGKK